MDRLADSKTLKQGLTKLGIGISDEVAEALLLELKGSTGSHFSARDLASFCGWHVVGGDELDACSLGRHCWEQRVVRSSNYVKPQEPQDRRVADTPMSNTSVQPDTGQAWGRRDREGEELASRTSRGAVLSQLFRCFEEPIPRKGCPKNPDESPDYGRKFRWDDLPTWARHTSRNALRELMDHHKE